MEEMEQSKDGDLNDQPLPTAISEEPISIPPADSTTTASIKPDSSRETPPSGIKYRVEYRNNEDDLIHSTEIDKHDFDITNQSHPHIFEVITTYRTNSTNLRSKNTPEEKDEKLPQVSDTRKRVKIIIHSHAIIHALRSVVKYYPGQDLVQEFITIPHPYPILVHHEKELEEFRERCNPSKQTGPMCVKEKNVYEHLKVLQNFLEETVMHAVRSERERNKRGLWTFDMLWLTMKPGTTWSIAIETSDVDNLTECVIQSVEDGIFGFKKMPWCVRFWKLDFDGKWIGRAQGSYFKYRFDGEQQIGLQTHTIPADDSDFEKLPESGQPTGKESRVADLVSRGKRFFDLLKGKCQNYSGTISEFPFRKIEGLVMADMKTFYIHYVPPNVSRSSEDSTWVLDCSCAACEGRQEQAAKNMETGFSYYDGIYLDDVNSLSNHHYFLLPKVTRAFVFKTRSWEPLYVSSLSEPSFEIQMMDTLVMDPVRLKTIKALAGSYIRENQHNEKSTLPPWNADFVQGKGQGQIFLLHGKPGVGKSYTAECVAQYTKRPLMVLTSSDIGTDPDEIENILMTKFKQAANWGAILLIDEADVFMEQRSTSDLNRNSLVAGFLRALEFYDGILFLTTNRVGTFDDAFMSRIHVKLYYPDFTDDERQQIWKTFMDKLIRDRGSFIRVSLDAKDYIKGSKIKEVKWNGREIRNAFQTAVALAEYEADKDEEGKILLKDTHLSAIVEMSQDFKKYLEDLHRADEDKRALQQGLRINQER